jgi:sec-independent protein translocase protein TatC
VLAIFVAAAVLTPTPDAFTLMLMAAPMLVLYEICIWLAWLDRRRNRVAEEQGAREREESRSADFSPPEESHYEAGDDGYSHEYEQKNFHDDFPHEPGDHPPENKNH